MMKSEILKGSAVFAIVIAAAWLSIPYADRYVASVSPVKAEPPAAEAGAVCVERDGSYRNWPWANAPTLSPPCPPER